MAARGCAGRGISATKDLKATPKQCMGGRTGSGISATKHTTHSHSCMAARGRTGSGISATKSQESVGDMVGRLWYAPAVAWCKCDRHSTPF